MNADVARLSAALAERMRELGVAPTDPRIAPLVSELQAAMRAPVAASAASHSTPTVACALELPDALAAPVRRYLADCPPQPFQQPPALNASDSGRSILALPPTDRVRIVVAAYHAWSAGQGTQRDGLRRIVSDLLRPKLPLSQADAVALVQSAVRDGFTYAGYSPNQAVLGALQRHVAAHGVSEDLRSALDTLHAEMAKRGAEHNVQGRKLLSEVDALRTRELPGSAEDQQPKLAPSFKLKADAWNEAVTARLAAWPAETQARLGTLLSLAGEGGKAAKPAKTWLKRAAQSLSQRDAIDTELIDLVEAHEPGTPIALENQETLRGLIWLAAMAAPAASARRLEAFAQKCLTFSAAHFAYLSLVLGNAAIHAFTLMPGTDGVASLSRLRRKLKRPGEIKTVDKALAALAQGQGLTAAELEEIGLPDYGFDADGRLGIPIGSATAVLSINETGVLETAWHAANGARLKGAPAEAKTLHGEALRELKARTKEIGETLKAQRDRLDRLYLSDREWPLAQWRARYLNEPLVAPLVRRLIWAFRLDDRWVAGLPDGARIRDEDGHALELAGEDISVRLWHPMHAEASRVLAWRQRLAELGVVQPFKQAHREIYVLTDAERHSATFSNRFASHILQQHQFRALCQARGWSVPAYGSWDPGGAVPVKRLPERGLNVEFWVEPVEGSLEQERFQFLFLSTDQVRFTDSAGQPLALAEVAPVLFSELMRDVDLFVSVANVGNDPTWPQRAVADQRDVWSTAAFGPLSETGKTRHTVLRDLLPGLAIAPQCRLEERYLVVTGKRRSYRIHLGSANVRMEPNDQYLCIVQDHQNAGARVRLPFEGDAILSLILSKAFLLVDDDTITDRAILSQIERS